MITDVNKAILYKKSRILMFISACIFFHIGYASAADTPVETFIKNFSKKHKIEESWVRQWIGKAKKQQGIIDAMNKPAESLPWHKYRTIWMKEKRIQAAVQFWNENRQILLKAEKEFKVPASIIVAIIGVETYFGRIQGKSSVLDALYTLGFHYPKRAAFFSKELEAFLLLCREQNWEPTQPKGSYAGAMGMGQFIPSSHRAYAVDFDGDGQINLFTNTQDAIGSVANYFRKHHWRYGEPVAYQITQLGSNAQQWKSKKLKPVHKAKALKQAGYDWLVNTNEQDNAAIYTYEQKEGKEHWVGFDNFYVITRYNRSPLYALAVFQFSQEVIAARAKAYIYD